MCTNRRLNRILQITFIIRAVINLVGAYYSENLNDFSTFFRSGRAFVQFINPYTMPEGLPTNINPPVSLLGVRYLPDIEQLTDYQVFRAISVVLYLGLVIVVARVYSGSNTPTKVAWAFGMIVLWYTILMGQVYVFLLLLTVPAWFLLRGNRWLLAVSEAEEQKISKAPILFCTFVGIERSR